MKAPFRRNTLLAALASSFITFVIMAATRPEPRTLFVASDGSILPDPPLAKAIPIFDADGLPFRAAVEKLSQQAGCLIEIHTEELRIAGFNAVPVTLHLKNATAGATLKAILQIESSPTLQLECWPGDDGVEVSTNYDAAAENSVTRFYNVNDLLKELLDPMQALYGKPNPMSDPAVLENPRLMLFREAQEDLRQLVEHTVDTDSWKDNGGTIGTIDYLGGVLWVTQTPRNQDAVAALLDQLAAAVASNPDGASFLRKWWPTTR